MEQYEDIRTEEKRPRSRRIRPTDVIRRNAALLKIDGVRILTVGDIMMLIGQEKAGKSNFTALFVAAYIGGGKYGITTEEPGGCVLHIDTEQEDYYAQMQTLRVCRYLGLNDDDGYVESHYFFYAQREIPNEERIDEIEYLLRVHRPALLIIDGIVDICADFNDVALADDTVQKLMTWSHEYGCAVIGVLHTNKTSTESARGHLGSMMIQKAETTMICSKDMDGNKFTLKAQSTRGKMPKERTFSYSETCNILVDNDSPEMTMYRMDRMLERIGGAFQNDGMTATKQMLADWTNSSNERVFKEMVSEAIRLGVIENIAGAGRPALYKLKYIGRG